jgi:hypothetical protein
MKTAAVIFLGTGRYFDLFERYSESIFKFLLPEYKKMFYFVVY